MAGKSLTGKEEMERRSQGRGYAEAWKFAMKNVYFRNYK
jgi:hypothetical protein